MVEPPPPYPGPPGNTETSITSFQQDLGQQPNWGQQVNNVVVLNPPTPAVQYRADSVLTVCPHCQSTVMTAICSEAGTMTWLLCCTLFFCCCGLGCCLIPFCVFGCKDVIHTCPNCNKQIYRYNRA